jgi:predicted aspartyl protease
MDQSIARKLTKAGFLAVVSLATISATQDGLPSLEATEVAPKEIASILPINLDLVVDKSQRMTVPVRLNGSEPYPFIIDTGAERSVIANDLGTLLGLKAGRELKLATVSGPHTSNSFEVDNLTMSSISVTNLELPALKRENIGAYGLLGIDSLENRKVVLNFAKGEINILPSKMRRKIDRSYGDVIVVTARRRAGRLVLTDARIGNVKVDVVIDTGAQSSMGNTALRNRLSRSQRRFEFIPVGLKSVTGEHIVGDYTQIKQIELGGLSIADLPMTFTNNYAFRALGLEQKPAILLGMDAMSLCETVEIDFAAKRVSFQLKRNSKIQSPGRLAWKESRTTAMSLSSPVIFNP